MPEMDWGPLWLTLQLAGVTVVVLLIVGTPVAWWLAYTSSRWKSIIEAIVALPLVLPPTVLGFYLLVALGPQGVIGGFWQSMTGSALSFTFTGLVIASSVASASGLV